MRGDGAASEENQAVRMMDKIGYDAAGFRKELGGPVCGAVRAGRAVAVGVGIGDWGHGVHFRPRALLGFVSATRGISCDRSQSCTTLIR